MESVFFSGSLFHLNPDLLRIPKKKPKQEYVSAFKPLMLEELGSQLVRGGGRGGGEAVVLSSSPVVVEVRETDEAASPISSIFPSTSSSRFTLVTLSLPRDADASALFADNDAVLVSVSSRAGAAGGGKRESFSALAVVDARAASAAPLEQTLPSKKRKQTSSSSFSAASGSTRGLLRLRLSLNPEEGNSGGGERQRARLRGVAGALLAAATSAAASTAAAASAFADFSSPSPEIRLSRLANLSTLAREWAALHAAATSPLAPLLLDPTSPEALALVSSSSVAAPAENNAEGGGEKQPSPLSRLPPPLRAALEAEFNPSQLLAAAAGISDPGDTSTSSSPRLALIQGPPGTGKTRTLLALLSVLLHGGGNGGETSTAVVAPSTPGQQQQQQQQPSPSAPLSPEDAARLWRRAAPWWGGAADPRDEALEMRRARGSRGGGSENGSESDADAAKSPSSRPSAPIRIRLGRGPPPRVLVCAPSNAALDEVVARLLSPGLLDASGRRYAPSVVRLGLRPSARASAASLDALVDARLRSAAAGGGGGGERGSGGGKRARDRARAEVLASARVVCATLSFAGSASLLGPLSGGGGETAGEMEEEDEGAEAEEAAEAEEVGRLLLRQQRRRGAAFAAVVVDEAAQAVEPSTLIALARCCSFSSGGASPSAPSAANAGAPKAGRGGKGGKNPVSAPCSSAPRPPPPSLLGRCARAFLIGDPAQLPATVLSARAARAGYERSLFARLAAAGRAAEKAAKRKRAAAAAAAAEEEEKGEKEKEKEKEGELSLPLLLPASAVPLLALDTQYRMHPAISAFPRAAFYNGGLGSGIGGEAGNQTHLQDQGQSQQQPQPPSLLLRDGPGVRASTSRGWHAHACFGPLAVFDVRGTESRATGGGNSGNSVGTSLENRAEAACVLALYRALVVRYPAARARGTVGVVTPYRAQAALLRSRLDAAMQQSQPQEGGTTTTAANNNSSASRRPPLSTTSALSPVEVGTVDGFQGREKDVVIVSAVRSSRGGGSGSGSSDGRRNSNFSLGFVADERRANVALTRARSSLLVVCNAPALAAGDETWRQLIEHARSKGCLFRAEPPFSAFVDGVVEGRTGAVPPRKQQQAPPPQQIQPQQQQQGQQQQQQQQQQRGRSQNQQQQQEQRRGSGGGDWKTAAAARAAARNAGVVLDADDDLSDDAPEPVGVAVAAAKVSTRKVLNGGGGGEASAVAPAAAAKEEEEEEAAAAAAAVSAQLPKRARRGAK